MSVYKQTPEGLVLIQKGTKPLPKVVAVVLKGKAVVTKTPTPIPITKTTEDK